MQFHQYIPNHIHMECGTHRESSAIINLRGISTSLTSNRVDVRGHKYVFDPTQTHFSPSVAKVKMRAEKGQKHIYAQEHQRYYYYNNFRGRLQQKRLQINMK